VRHGRFARRHRKRDDAELQHRRWHLGTGMTHAQGQWGCGVCSVILAGPSKCAAFQAPALGARRRPQQQRGSGIATQWAGPCSVAPGLADCALRPILLATRTADQAPAGRSRRHPRRLWALSVASGQQSAPVTCFFKRKALLSIRTAQHGRPRGGLTGTGPSPGT
jgi:hypothetical protein